MKFVLFAEKSDTSHLHKYKAFLRDHQVNVVMDESPYIYRVEQECKNMGTDKVLCTSLALLKKLVSVLLPETEQDDITSTHVYRGSVFKIPTTNISVLILPPPRNLQFQYDLRWAVPRWLQKFTRADFPTFPPVSWEHITADNIDAIIEKAESAILIGVDIETVREEINGDLVKGKPEYDGLWVYGKINPKGSKLAYFIPKITMVAYSFLYEGKGGLYSQTGVLILRDMESVSMMRRLNLIDAPKVMQNGGYDSTYFLRYDCPLRNYLYDTFLMMHSWVVEADRDLSFITSLFDKDYIYWKDEAGFNMPQYNARDAHNTLWSMVYMIQYLQPYAKNNYAENFRMQFPCIHMGMEGWKVDISEMQTLRAEYVAILAELQRWFDMVIHPGFNPNSSVQVLPLLRGLGYTKAKDSEESTIKDFMNYSILWNVIGEKILDYRGTLKAISTYFNSKLMGGRFLYELSPITDTGRMASKASNLWCGSNIQNQPFYVKSIYIADEGYMLNSMDNKQSESRCTAYLSQDEGAIAAVESPLDFHKVNASGFFGIPYESITKEIRDVSKRVNHGANYNMQEGVLLDTMGLKMVLKAKKLLQLPSGWSPKKVCQYLLECFDKRYPRIRGRWYQELIDEIKLTGKLTTPNGWVRRCFGDPTENKRVLNSYVAHKPQSLSVKMINKTLFAAWLELQIKRKTLRFKAQVHDDLIWQDKDEHREANAAFISASMMEPMIIEGRSMVIPNDPVLGRQSWKKLKV